MLKPIRIALAIIIVLTPLPPATVWAADAGELTIDMVDGAGNTITNATFSAVGEPSTTPSRELMLSPRMVPPSRLSRADYQSVYDEARDLLDVGVTFRTTEIQNPLPGGGYGIPFEDVLLNYKDYNNGDLFYKFCADYDQLNQDGSCLGSDNVRNKLIRARRLFAMMSVADPANLALDTDGDPETTPLNIREIGRAGVLEAIRELVNIHLIFGNEFMVDALDYRFSDTSMSADAIIAEELEQLRLAAQQYTLAFDVLAHALNADIGGPNKTYIADFFTADDFERFSIISQRMVEVTDQLGRRYRQRRLDDEALALYAQAATSQYAHALALATKAEARGVDFLDNGGWQLMNNLNQLHARAQAIRDGLNPFGFTEDYVPLLTFGELHALTQNQFLRDAEEDEGAAQTGQREFDRNATALNTELQNLRTSYDRQLLEMCGATEDDFLTCVGGTMEQNYLAMSAASRQIQLASQRLANIPAQIQIEEERAGRVIEITIEGGTKLSALAYSIGVRNAYRETKTIAESTKETWYNSNRGFTSEFDVVAIGTAFISQDWGAAAVGIINGIAGGLFGGSNKESYRHEYSKTQAVTKTWEPAQQEIGRLNGLKEVQSAATQAQITGANSAAAIRNLLLRQAELLIELDLAYDHWNQLSAEHNHLVESYHNLLGLRTRAQQNLLDSYLNNPAYRIFRETLTLEAARSHEVATQFAYLTAKALEYEFLTPVPTTIMDDIYKARTADDIDNFLNDLLQYAQNLSLGQRNRYPYRISVAEDLLGLSDANLDPNGELSPSQRAQLRYDQFQAYIQQYTETDTLTLPFTTSVLDNKVFSQNIWNSRIAGIGLPAEVPNLQGLSINLLTHQFGDVGTPEVILTHGGQASYRTAINEIVEYTPGPARLIELPIPPGFENKNTSAVILSSVNGNGQGTPTSALFNLSVAASTWTLQVDFTSPFNRNLDLSQLEDIEILMDTTGIGLQGLQQQAVADSQHLAADFAQGMRRSTLDSLPQE